MSFQSILEDLRAASGAIGAIMVAEDGEVVAAAVGAEGADMELLGAHNAIVLERIREACKRLQGCGPVQSVLITNAYARIMISALKEDYSLILLLPRSSPSGKALFEAGFAVMKIEKEMG